MDCREPGEGIERMGAAGIADDEPASGSGNAEGFAEGSTPLGGRNDVAKRVVADEQVVAGRRQRLEVSHVADHEGGGQPISLGEPASDLDPGGVPVDRGYAGTSGGEVQRHRPEAAAEIEDLGPGQIGKAVAGQEVEKELGASRDGVGVRLKRDPAGVSGRIHSRRSEMIGDLRAETRDELGEARRVGLASRPRRQGEACPSGCGLGGEAVLRARRGKAAGRPTGQGRMPSCWDGLSRGWV